MRKRPPIPLDRELLLCQACSQGPQAHWHTELGECLFNPGTHYTEHPDNQMFTWDLLLIMLERDDPEP